MFISKRKRFPTCSMRWSCLGPAPVTIVRLEPVCPESIKSAAAQRVPLPEISASLPSALNKRIVLPRTMIQPSAPTPVCRLQIARATAGRLVCGAWSDQVSRKSLPAPCALVNGIRIAVSSIDFDDRHALHADRVHQFITRPVHSRLGHGGRHGVASLRYGPTLVEEIVGACHAGIPLRFVAVVQGLGHWDTGLTEDSGEISQHREDSTAVIVGIKEGCRFMRPESAGLGVDLRLFPADPVFGLWMSDPPTGRDEGEHDRNGCVSLAWRQENQRSTGKCEEGKRGQAVTRVVVRKWREVRDEDGRAR